MGLDGVVLDKFLRLLLRESAYANEETSIKQKFP
jgi:hypothetical protein